MLDIYCMVIMKLGTRDLKWFLAGLFLIFAGLEIAVTLTYLPRMLGLVLILAGVGVMIFLAQKKPVTTKAVESEETEGDEEKEEKKTLAEHLINILTLKGRITFALPVIGVLIVIFVYAFNLLRTQELDLGVNDTITILLGLTLLLYNYVPVKFKAERDFVLLFFVFLFLILVVPITLYSLYSGPLEENTNSPFVYYLLAEPTAGMLNFFGISSSAHLVSSPETVTGIYLSTSGVYIVYENLGGSQQSSLSSVMIGLSCTGLDSVTIFISGFTAFILMEYRKVDVKVASLLTLGVLTSWFANILRMTIIVVVGSHYGSDALEWTHANLGIIIFMIWVAIFWGIMFKLLVPAESGDGEGPGPEGPEGEKSHEMDGPENTAPDEPGTEPVDEPLPDNG
jgi:exosortase/archaeosortase family protein